MLARPEIGTRAHILLWLAGKDPKATYEWECYSLCACGQYARECAGKSNLWWTTVACTPQGEPLFELNHLAQDAKTFGELHKRALAAWGSRLTV